MMTLACLTSESNMTEEQALARKTLDLFHWYDSAHEFTHNVPGCTQEHICDILQQVVDGIVTGGKANRFIGWAQSVLTIEGYITLDGSRNINREAIEELQ